MAKKDRDGDGIPDWLDITPNKPFGAARAVTAGRLHKVGDLLDFLGGKGKRPIGQLLDGMGYAAHALADKTIDKGLIPGFFELGDEIIAEEIDPSPEIELAEEEVIQKPISTLSEGQLGRGDTSSSTNIYRATPSVPAWMLPSTTSRGFWNMFRR